VAARCTDAAGAAACAGADHAGATGGGGVEHMCRLGRRAVRTLVPTLVRGFGVASVVVIVVPLVLVILAVLVCVHRRLP